MHKIYLAELYHSQDLCTGASVIPYVDWLHNLPPSQNQGFEKEHLLPPGGNLNIFVRLLKFMTFLALLRIYVETWISKVSYLKCLYSTSSFQYIQDVNIY